MQTEIKVLENRLKDYSLRVAGKLRAKGLDKIQVFQRQREGLPNETLFLDRDGRWLLQDFDTEKYPDAYILPPPERIYYVYAWRTDSIVQFLWQRYLERSSTIERKYRERDAKTGENSYDASEEAQDAITHYWSTLWESHIETHKATYLNELIDLLDMLLT